MNIVSEYLSDMTAASKARSAERAAERKESPAATANRRLQIGLIWFIIFGFILLFTLPILFHNFWAFPAVLIPGCVIALVWSHMIDWHYGKHVRSEQDEAWRKRHPDLYVGPGESE